jgi:hypothetical protein
MHKGKREQSLPSPSQQLIQAGAQAELRLLRQERKAEQRLAQAINIMQSDQARLDKAQERLAHSRTAVETAASTLREAQARRAAGPDVER